MREWLIFYLFFSLLSAGFLVPPTGFPCNEKRSITSNDVLTVPVGSSGSGVGTGVETGPETGEGTETGED
ncbi:MAG: hypothetical protein LC732_02210 [Acidobacteria bacterium]|nr:hypothetical protein [Acidobacteriota bacterium]